ncbi:hypothetical protein A3A36_01155 [Candidatus Kaiserbacteria bacterium RIFCSPLOWO2_01_FULL_52_12b]|uniref:Uncharacterized protein n=1 Tax=Candidatus Kaiserbacteria bacterium RIFCSPLOWO2_01_FULL_52_12b TaxID=1798509 RepID=A0A1F6EWX8_9BACT|nr:MAG: hypothetical protein A3A36_01155 [Candidatus Kaiserbacteria bacterium RIFCSPLOWO2_01_FULL_52_12b]
MIKTVNEGLEKYKAALGDYKEWSDRLAGKYDAIYGKGKWNAFEHFSIRDLSVLEQRNAQLKAMTTVLGLTKEEEAVIDKECGIKSQQELATA